MGAFHLKFKSAYDVVRKGKRIGHTRHLCVCSRKWGTGPIR